MKPALSTGVLLLYLVLASGPQILVHTCGGETDVDVMPVAATDPCGCDNDPSQEPCCTVQLVTLHLDEAQKAGMPVVERPVTPPVGVADAREFSSAADAHARVPASSTPSPPNPVPPTILNCTFLI